MELALEKFHLLEIIEIKFYMEIKVELSQFVC